MSKKRSLSLFPIMFVKANQTQYMKHLQVYTEGNTDSNMSTALYNFSPFLKDTGMRKDLSKGWRTS